MLYCKKYELSFLKTIDFTNDTNITKKLWYFNNKKYDIVKYKKENLTVKSYDTYGLCRSIILDENKIIVFSPPKSLDKDMFMNYYKENECIAEEFIEGTMINLFYDSSISKWEISTKSSVGGNIKFFKNQPLFSELFKDVCEHLGVNVKNFDKNYCYSFVMQHPDNNIVIPIIEKSLYLVAVYQINNDKFEVTEIAKSEYNNLSLPTQVRVPFGHYFQSYEELIKNYCSMNTHTFCMGIVIKHMNGDRIKLRNPNYEYAKQLRGNNCKLQYQFLCLNKDKKIKEYLRFYPKHEEEFNFYTKNLHLFTESLFSNYVECYIKKVKPLKEYPHQFRNHMFSLHQYYLANKCDGKYINLPTVINYVRELEPARLMYSINYHLRDLTSNKDKDIESVI